MKNLYVVLVALLISNTCFADIIYLKSKKIVEGEILEEKDDYIKINVHNVPLTYFKDDIHFIEQKGNIISEDKLAPDWIVGSWEKTYDPDNEPNEIIVFKKDGSLVARIPDENIVVHGYYRVLEEKQTVIIDLLINGKKFLGGKEPLTFDKSKNKLYFTSNGTTAYYEKNPAHDGQE